MSAFALRCLYCSSVAVDAALVLLLVSLCSTANCSAAPAPAATAAATAAAIGVQLGDSQRLVRCPVRTRMAAFAGHPAAPFPSAAGASGLLVSSLFAAVHAPCVGVECDHSDAAASHAPTAPFPSAATFLTHRAVARCHDLRLVPGLSISSPSRARVPPVRSAASGRGHHAAGLAAAVRRRHIGSPAAPSSLSAASSVPHTVHTRQSGYEHY